MLAKSVPAAEMVPKSYYFCPEDLARLRHAFIAACLERPLAAQTEAQRVALSKAVVVTYRPEILEKDLVAAALQLAAADSP